MAEPWGMHDGDLNLSTRHKEAIRRAFPVRCGRFPRWEPAAKGLCRMGRLVLFQASGGANEPRSFRSAELKDREKAESIPVSLAKSLECDFLAIADGRANGTQISSQCAVVDGFFGGWTRGRFG